MLILPYLTVVYFKGLNPSLFPLKERVGGKITSKQAETKWFSWVGQRTIMSFSFP